MKSLLFLFVISSMSCCQIMMLPEGELINTPMNVVEQDGKSVWFIYRDSVGNNYTIEDGIHKYKYSLYHSFSKRIMIVEQFNLSGEYITSDTTVAICKLKEVYKHGKLVEQSFMDRNNQLVKPNYLPYAKVKQHYYADNTWRTRYYDSNNKRSCANGWREVHTGYDTIRLNDSDTNFMISIKILDGKKCVSNDE